jgi:crossover junction endodeoxyribonuclease RuvC
MIIMGLDPGIARVGWAILNIQKGKLSPLSYGCITTDKGLDHPIRLLQIYDAVYHLLTKYHPDCFAVEELFFSTNAKTAIGVGQSRGVVLLAAAKTATPVVSYSPLAVKRAVCGDGKADKNQVGRMVTRILKLRKMPKPDDTADALAIAMTHAYSYRIKRLSITNYI